MLKSALRASSVLAVSASLVPMVRAQFDQQGSKLVAVNTLGNPVGIAHEGSSVALSNDGNIAIIGGPANNGPGAAWVFSRSNGDWIQESTELAGTGTIEAGGGASVNQGAAVALSGDGNTAIVGGMGDDYLNGAAWVYVRSNGFWLQQ